MYSQSAGVQLIIVCSWPLDLRAVPTYEKTIHDRRTGRQCALCGGALLATIINFGEYLVISDDSTVNEIPETVGRKREAKLVICNLQPTPLNGLSDIRVFAEANDFMSRIETTKEDRLQLTVKAVDVDDTLIIFLQSMKSDYNRRTVRSEQFPVILRSSPEPGTQMKPEFKFMGHYVEPNLDVTYDYQDAGSGGVLPT
ncbi:hypothetical protein F5Y19DRAFT_486398 [Xylariaceae sp. FL1651]|nr:hypothetical protein F5Y19DRAFT_486398 [Xylariaceae sp. FL1651]